MNALENSISKEDFLKNILYILRETFEGLPEGQSNTYLDRDIGVFATLKELSAKEASQEISATTIAAHTEHTKFYLDRLVEFIEGGKKDNVNWELSWLIETVNETEWNTLREGVRKSYEEVLRCLIEVENWDQNSIGGAIAIIAHTAYHLGSIRQILKEAKS